MQVRFVGCGDALGSGGRFNTCFHITGARINFLIDCGASTLPSLKRLGIARDGIDLILITHFHGDHFGGLPFLLLDAQFTRRTRRMDGDAGPARTRRRPVHRRGLLLRQDREESPQPENAGGPSARNQTEAAHSDPYERRHARAARYARPCGCERRHARRAVTQTGQSSAVIAAASAPTISDSVSRPVRNKVDARSFLMSSTRPSPL